MVVPAGRILFAQAIYFKGPVDELHMVTGGRFWEWTGRVRVDPIGAYRSGLGCCCVPWSRGQRAE